MHILLCGNTQDYFVSKMEKGSKGQANLIVFCDGGSSSLKELDQSRDSM